jgi:hypothetical protein
MSYLRLRLSAATALLLFNTSCGSGDGGSTSMPVAVTPSPTPTPSATPTPTFTYGTFDLEANRSLVGQLATVRTTVRYVSDTSPFYAIESQDAELRPARYAAEWDYQANRSIFVRLPSETVALTATDVSGSEASSNVTGVQWRRPRVGSTRGDAAAFARLAPYEYLYFVSHEADEDVRTPGTASAFRQTFQYGLVGERTRDGDAPTAGTTTYAATISTSAVARNGGSGFASADAPTFAITVDHATGQVVARFNAYQPGTVTGTQSARATLVFTGTVTAGGLIGTITSPDTGYTGTFAGDLFGPQAVEIGLVFTLSRPDGDRAAGRLVGRRR